jgi:acetyltransferase-like isoleucine patch superfamily enzyme
MNFETFSVAEAHIDYLRANKIFYHPSGTYPPGWFKPGLRYRATFDLWVEPWSDHRSGPTFSALGAFSYSRSCFGSDARIGRYCAIGDNVTVMRPNHPIDRVSMCGFDYDNRPSPYGPYARETGFEFPLVPLPAEVFVGGVDIGPDVWIGSNALIARGVKIGAGAIIAANSVVTRNVEPYTLVAGNPARAKRRRFNDHTCERLLASAWWDYPFDAFVGMETTNPERFLGQFDEAVASGTIAKMPENRINLHAAFQEIAVQVREKEEEAAQVKAQAAQQARIAAEEHVRVPLDPSAWTPVLTCTTPGDLDVTYSTQIGRVQRIEKLRICTFEIVTSSFNWSTASGSLQITGLPDVAMNEAQIISGTVSWSGVTKPNYTQMVPRVGPRSNRINFVCSGSGQGQSDLVVADLPSAGTKRLTGTVIYIARD